MNRRLSTLLAVFAVSTSSTAASWGALGDKKVGAQHAIRWNIADGGPQTAEETLKLLGQAATDTDDYTVVYFDSKIPSDAPQGFTSVLRQRTKEKKVELTFTYRGQHKLTSWKCPLPHPTETKGEIDEWFVTNDVKRIYSYSCSIEDKKPIAPPAALEASRPCTSKVTRTKAGNLEIKVWALPNGMKMIEVSRNDDTSKKDREAFRTQIASKLKKAGIKPLERGMAELGKSCP